VQWNVRLTALLVIGSGVWFGGVLSDSLNSPAFQRRDCGRLNSSPEGTAERNTVIAVFQPSLRDFIWGDIHPSVETLGYFHLSLRDIHF